MVRVPRRHWGKDENNLVLSNLDGSTRARARSNGSTMITVMKYL